MRNKAKILVVEHELPVAMRMVFLLSKAGCHVRVAPNGHSGLEVAKVEKFDLITLGVDLPDLDGFEICRELRQRHISYRTPIVLVSGRENDEHRHKAYRLGATDFIEKHFQPDEFVARILSFIVKTGGRMSSRAVALEK